MAFGDVRFHLHLTLLRRGYIRSVLHNLQKLAVDIVNGVVRCLNPDFTTGLANTSSHSGLVLACLQVGPELTVLSASDGFGIHKHRVMLADDFFLRISDSVQEVIVRLQNVAIHVEFDGGLSPVDGGQLSFVVSIPELGYCDVGCILDDLEWFAVTIDNRVVRCLNPDFSTALANPFVFACVIFAFIQVGPELTILGTSNFSRG